MIKAILVGACGKMGLNVTARAKEDVDIKIVAGIDKYNSGMEYPIFASFKEINTEADVIIDFSNPLLLDDLLKYAIEKKLPV
ncbi:MAG: 4-hydroxy-tetrahydrodipicolinate reductase, partial [Clostridia bacterium]|nr:4-hydroxy-tetrahydrodipicolinate reductase [Clostridia bacterium]